MRLLATRYETQLGCNIVEVEARASSLLLFHYYDSFLVRLLGSNGDMVPQP